MSTGMGAIVGAGTALPEVVLEGPEGPLSLEALRAGRPMVVAFYTEDATPTCSAQLGAFRDDFELIGELGAAFVAISADSTESQRAFTATQGFPFPLLSDPALAAARAFGVVDETGKRSIRALFVADADGVIVASIPYYNPSNMGQYQAVFEALGMNLG